MLAAGGAVAATRCDKIERVDALNECLGDELGIADKALNSTYAELRRKLAPERQEVLKKAETAWIALRDNDCDFEASAAVGGTAYQSLNLSCQIEATKRRLRLLQDWRKRSL
ncbi:lysozyme inhibitor LprI family protein [Acidovorax sp.]|uniref:lysozyme inhibitor LprI family protein n=1 Tax=Acidovorax sp. TaxID=1872122 RepID=UPI003440CB60